MRAPPLSMHEGEAAWRLIGRWAGAAACVAAAHAGVTWAVMNWPRPEIPAGEPPSAIMIEFAPVPLAPEAPQQDVAVGPEMTMSQQSNASELSEETPPEELEETEQKMTKAEPVEVAVEQEVETELDIPELPVIEDAEVSLVKPAEKPPEIETVEEETPPPPPKPKPKKAEDSDVQQNTQASAPTTAAPKPLDVQRAKTNAAPSSGVSSSRSITTWRGMVMAHLNRRKRHPGGSARGTSSVAFVIDRSGRVLSARLIRSSGSSALDRAAVALARRASPVPAPPANIGQGRITLTVPIHFSR